MFWFYSITRCNPKFSKCSVGAGHEVVGAVDSLYFSEDFQQ